MEMEDFGYPPIFREMENVDEHKTLNAESELIVKDKAKGKKASNCFTQQPFYGPILAWY